MNRVSAIITIVASSLVYPVVANASEANVSEIWTATDIRTAIEFYPTVLQDLGIEIVDLRTTTSPVQQHDLSVLNDNAPAFHAAQPWSMKFTTKNDHFEGVFSGAARHQGGFELSWRGGGVSLQGFMVRPGAEPRSLEVVTADNRVVFNGTHLHWAVDTEAGLLEMFNVDLRLTKEMAISLGREAFEGKPVATLSLTAAVQPPQGYAPETGIPSCTPSDWSGDQDVQLINIGTVNQLARSNGEVVMVPSATLKNVGTANVPWLSKFSGFSDPYNNDQHPFLTWSVFRITGEGIHQLGVSAIKHAFLTININCNPGACTTGHVLGLGCEDVYGTGTNSSNGDLAPREEILAASSVWAHCNEPVANTPSHFDQDGNCSQDHFGGGENAFSHGLIVQESDLADDTASYYFSAWYLVRDDIDIFNTMGYRKINPVFGGNNWTFSFQTGLANGSPLDAWIPSGTNEETQNNAVLARGLGQGNLQLAVNVADLGDGYFRYDYALMNHDFDQGLDGFSIPIPAGASVRSTSFRDIDQDGANDWQVSIATDSVTWTMPDATSFQPWGVVFNFSLEANTAPLVANAVMDVVGKFRPETLEISTRAPSPLPTDIFSDGFESGDVSAWSSSSP